MKGRAKVRKGKGHWLDKDHVGYLFIFPSCLILFIFTIVPLLFSFIFSLTDLNIFLGVPNFVKLDNFKESFTDFRAWNSLTNTFIYVLATVPIHMALALALAFLLYRPTRFNKLCRSVFYIPVLCSFTSIGILFNLLLNSTVGYIPYIIKLLTGETIAVFSDVRFAMPVIAFIGIWKSFGRTLIILVAGINDIPYTLYEASAIDGANKFQQFFRITIPNLLPTINFTLLTSLINAFQVFDVVFVTTGGGPGFSTETMVQYIYSSGFNAPYNLGYASALSVELFFVIAVILLVFKGLIERKIKRNF